MYYFNIILQQMNYWDSLPDDIRFKIIFDVLWTDSREQYLSKLKNNKVELNTFLHKTFPHDHQKWKQEKYYNLFIKKGIINIEKLKTYSKNDLYKIGVKWGSLTMITHYLSIQT